MNFYFLIHTDFPKIGMYILSKNFQKIQKFPQKNLRIVGTTEGRKKGVSMALERILRRFIGGSDTNS